MHVLFFSASLIPRPFSNLSKSSSSSLTILDKTSAGGAPEKAGNVPNATKALKTMSLPHGENIQNSSLLELPPLEHLLLTSTGSTGTDSLETVNSSPSAIGIGIDAIVGHVRTGSDISSIGENGILPNLEYEILPNSENVILPDLECEILSNSESGILPNSESKIANTNYYRSSSKTNALDEGIDAINFQDSMQEKET